VNVKVKYALSGPFPDVGHGAVAGLRDPFEASYFCHRQEQISRQISVFRREGIRALHVPPRNDEDVNRSLGLYIAERQPRFALGHHISRDLATNDPAKQTFIADHELTSRVPRRWTVSRSSTTENLLCDNRQARDRRRFESEHQRAQAGWPKSSAIQERYLAVAPSALGPHEQFQATRSTPRIEDPSESVARAIESNPQRRAVRPAAV
jgi:hypothetical protein